MKALEQLSAVPPAAIADGAQATSTADNHAGGVERQETAEIVADAGRLATAIEALLDRPGSGPRGRRGR